MRTLRISGAVLLVLLFISAVWYVLRQTDTQPALRAELSQLPSSPRDAAYVIDGYEITLRDGKGSKEFGSEEGADPAFTTMFTYNGEPTFADVNVDGIEDAIGVLVSEPGGSGSFSYVVAALSDGKGYLGTNGILLGDRVALEYLGYSNDLIVVRYRTRADDQPMAAPPTLGRTMYLMVSGIELRDVSPASEETVLEGNLTRDGERFVFDRCGGEPSALDETSRAYAALEAVFLERSRGATTSEVFVVLAGSETQVERDGVLEVLIDASSILAAPEDGVCSPSREETSGGSVVPPDSPRATTTDDLTDDEAALE